MANASNILAKLSPALQRDLSLERLSSTMLQFPLFRGAARAFIAELAQAHSWAQCLQLDLGMEAGQLIQDLIFVIHGQLVMHGEELGHEVNDDSLQVMNVNTIKVVDEETELGAGAWCGEACLFFDRHMCTATVHAVLESELAVLAARDYHKVLQKFPALLERHNRLNEALRSEELSLKSLAYVRTRTRMHSSSKNARREGACETLPAGSGSEIAIVPA